jgi:hypothetical protein
MSEARSIAVITPVEIGILLQLREDTSNLIAAGKVQRWEVVKWVLAVNVALATASVAPVFNSGGRFFIFLFALAISGFGSWLLSHYNSRMTAARKRLQALNTYIQKHVTDINAIGAGEWDKSKDEDYDWQEIHIFNWAVWLSLVPPLLAWLI